MRINSNLSAMNTYSKLGSANSAKSKSLEKLSSGLRINRAGDDAAGLTISEKMRGQISGLNQAAKNAQDGISLIQTAEGALSETHSILNRMRELSVQASNSTITDDDRNAIQEEVIQLKSEVDRIGTNTEFNTKKLLNGDLSGSISGGVGKSLGKATSASIETGDFDPADFTAGSTTNFQVKLDGKTFDLTGVESGDTFAFFTSLETKLKAAIDDYNDANPTDKVEYAKFEIDVTNANKMNFKITSGTTGTKSNISITALEDEANTAAQDDDKFQALLTNKANSTPSSDGKLTEAVTVEANDVLKMSFNGNAIDVKLTNATGTYVANDDVKDLADKLQEDINASLDEYKALTGKDLGNVEVTVKDGQISITSDKSDTVSFQITGDKEGVADKLGLSNVASGAEGGLDFHIGANKGQSINLKMNDMTTKGLEIADIDVSTREGADNAIAVLDEAIKSVSTERSKLGATQNRLDHTINNLTTTSENLSAAESRIRDVDMAQEMMEFTKNNILSQAATSMLAQANQMPQSVLQLLQ